jgi:phage tail-like protein
MSNALLTTLVDKGMEAIGLVNEPAPAYKFYVEILGIIVAEFSECSGLGMEREVQRYREGGTNDFEWILPGQITFPNITLKRGITYSRELWRWFVTGSIDGMVFGPNMGGYLEKGVNVLLGLFTDNKVHLAPGTNMSIILGNAQGLKVKHWDITGAIPVKWSGPDFNTSSDQVAIETLEFAHHGLDLSFEMMLPMGGFFGLATDALDSRSFD